MNFIKLAACIAVAGACLATGPAAAQMTSTETVLDAAGPDGPLKGTLLSPAKPTAAVLIVPGSGPTDRDGNSPLGVKASTYRLLAEGLAARGVATLRIDKRGLFASAAAAKDANAVTIADYVDDVRAWSGVLAGRTHAPCVWILGHSEGGLVALASANAVPNVCGLVLVATPGRRMGDVLRDQLKANPANAPILGQALPAIDALEQGHRVDTKDMHPALQGLFNPAVQGFLISAFSYDPARLVAGVGKPVLLVQGARDLQVGERDAQLLKQADPRAELVVLPDANHVLKAVASDDPRANVATYADPGLPLAPGVVDAISGFLSRNAGGPPRE
jgi:alpha-beta hydrolase superfamily lysophospholipase